MIRIVTSIRIRNLDSGELAWRGLPLIPASATLSRTESSSEHGIVSEVKLQAGLYEEVPGLSGNLEVTVRFDNGESCTIGSPELPARFKITTDNTVVVSLEYREPVN